MVSLRMQAKRARAAAAVRRARSSARPVSDMGAFQVLPTELIVSILTALAASADKPTDLFNAMLVCREFLKVVITPDVLRAASAHCVSVLPSSRWCAAAERFLRYCGDKGNADANYFLGMVQFYCLGRHSEGWHRLMLALMGNHAHAAFAAAVINNNGSFRESHNHHLNAMSAAHLFALAADNGHEGALRDLALCVANGAGAGGAATAVRLTITCNLRELRARFPTMAGRRLGLAHFAANPLCLASELGCSTTVPASLNGYAHPVNRFLCGWFAPAPAPRRRLLPLMPMLCSFPTCGRPETRALEYRRCHVCGIARYCSRTCQSLHWRTTHTRECVPVHVWLIEAIANANLQAAVFVHANADVNNNNNNNNLDGDAGAGASGPAPAPAPDAPM